jgi:hypothetical protein
MMRRKHPFPLIATLLGLVLSGGMACYAEQESTENSFVRLTDDENGTPCALETAIVRFERPGDADSPAVTVDLVAVIHIADGGYYRELNARFRKYDAVLYELVARKDANVPQPGRRSASAVGGMQVGMKSLLDLEYQLDCIDYAQENMIHADMSPEEFSEAMKKRNESFVGMFFRMMGRGFAEQAKDPLGSGDVQLLAALLAEDRSHQLKLVLAKQFAELDGAVDIFDGPEGSTIITDRNEKALGVLKEQLQKGKQKIAVFFGAGHLRHMQERLSKDFGMKRVRTDWLAAWSLVPEKEELSQQE